MKWSLGFFPKCFDYRRWNIQVNLYFTINSAHLSFSRKFSLINDFMYFYYHSICELVCSIIMLFSKSFKHAILFEPAGGNGMSLDTNPHTNVVVPISSMVGLSHVPGSAKLGVSDCSNPSFFLMLLMLMICLKLKKM